MAQQRWLNLNHIFDEHKITWNKEVNSPNLVESALTCEISLMNNRFEFGGEENVFNYLSWVMNPTLIVP